MMAWQDFGTSELAVNSPITQELITKMNDRDKSLCDGSVLWKWTPLSTGIGVDILFAKVWVPRSASFMYCQCQSGKSGGAGTAPRALIRATDGASPSAGGYADLTGIAQFSRVSFPVVPITAALRNKIVSLYFRAEDAPASTLLFYVGNVQTLPDMGYGVRFTG